MLTPEQLAKKVGQKVLFIGIEAYSWNLNDYVTAAKNARAMGFDTIAPKQADGGYRWYTNVSALKARRDAVLACGVGFLPFTYMYGPKFGNGQIALEYAIAREIAEVNDGLVCLDLEVEWNGQEDAARLLATHLQNFPGDIILSTWADPVQQNWLGVLKALDPVVSAWGPQQYTNWLNEQENQFAQAGVNLIKIFPEIDIADLYAANNPLAILADGIARGHNSFWVWEYSAALANATLIKAVLNLLPKNINIIPDKPQPPRTLLHPTSTVTGVPASTSKDLAPANVPVPDHTSVIYAQYTIRDGDTLELVAQHLHIRNWYQDLFLPNKVTLDQAAQAYGQPNSGNGNLVYAGTVIRYPIIPGVRP